MRALEPWHIIVLVVVLVLLFGSKRLPDAARGLGRSMRIFKSEMKEMSDTDSSNSSGSSGSSSSTSSDARPREVEGRVVEDSPSNHDTQRHEA